MSDTTNIKESPDPMKPYLERLEAKLNTEEFKGKIAVDVEKVKRYFQRCGEFNEANADADIDSAIDLFGTALPLNAGNAGNPRGAGCDRDFTRMKENSLPIDPLGRVAVYD